MNPFQYSMSGHPLGRGGGFRVPVQDGTTRTSVSKSNNNAAGSGHGSAVHVGAPPLRYWSQETPMSTPYSHHAMMSLSTGSHAMMTSSFPGNAFTPPPYHPVAATGNRQMILGTSGPSSAPMSHPPRQVTTTASLLSAATEATVFDFRYGGRLPALSTMTKLPFQGFDTKAMTVMILPEDIPKYLRDDLDHKDWRSGSVLKGFILPVQYKEGKWIKKKYNGDCLVPPVGPVAHCKTIYDRTVLLNWWGNLSKAKQKDFNVVFKKVFLTPTTNGKLQAQRKDASSAAAAAAAGERPGAISILDSQVDKENHVNESNIVKNTKKSKNSRKNKQDKPMTNGQVTDRISRTQLEYFFAQQLKVKEITTPDNGIELAAKIETITITRITGVKKNPSGTLLSRRALVEEFFVSADNEHFLDEMLSLDPNALKSKSSVLWFLDKSKTVPSLVKKKTFPTMEMSDDEDDDPSSRILRYSHDYERDDN